MNIDIYTAVTNSDSSPQDATVTYTIDLTSGGKTIRLQGTTGAVTWPSGQNNQIISLTPLSTSSLTEGGK